MKLSPALRLCRPLALGPAASRVEWWAGMGLGLLVACSQEARERPPFAEQSCYTEGCAPVGGPGGGVVAAPDSNASPSSDAQTSETAAAGDADVAQSVILEPQEATDLGNTTGASLARRYAVYLWPDETTPVLRSEGLAAESVTVASAGQWLLVVVLDSSDAVDPNWLPTLSWQEPSAEPVVLPVFRTQFWIDMAASQANTPTVLDPQAAQVLLQVADENHAFKAGVSAEVPSGVIAYGAGGTALDALAATNDTGLIVWMNAPVQPEAEITLTFEGDRWSAVAPTRAGTLTIAGFQR